MSDEEATAEDETYIVPEGHGRFLFRYLLLQGAARTYAMGNIQYDCNLIANWLTTGLDTAILRAGWHLLSPTWQRAAMETWRLRTYFAQGYPEMQQTDRPYQRAHKKPYRATKWAQAVRWLTGDPTFLNKLNAFSDKKKMRASWKVC